MARIKPMTGKLESLEDVNLALRDIGLAERELTQIDTEAHKKIAEIKTAAAEKGEALRKRIAELSTKIQAFRLIQTTTGTSCSRTAKQLNSRSGFSDTGNLQKFRLKKQLLSCCGN